MLALTTVCAVPSCPAAACMYKKERRDRHALKVRPCKQLLQHLSSVRQFCFINTKTDVPFSFAQHLTTGYGYRTSIYSCSTSFFLIFGTTLLESKCLSSCWIWIFSTEKKLTATFLTDVNMAFVNHSNSLHKDQYSWENRVSHFILYFSIPLMTNESCREAWTCTRLHLLLVHTTRQLFPGTSLQTQK